MVVGDDQDLAMACQQMVWHPRFCSHVATLFQFLRWH